VLDTVDMDPDHADDALPLTAAMRDALNGVSLDAAKIGEARGKLDAAFYVLAAHEAVLLEVVGRLEADLIGIASKAGLASIPFT